MNLILVLCFGLVAVASSEKYEPVLHSVLHSFYNMYKVCGGFSALEECLSTKVAVDLDRLQRADTIPLSDWLVLKRSSTKGQYEPPLTEEALEMTLPRSIGDRQERLDAIIMDKVAGIITGRNLQFQWKPSSGLEVDEQGRTLKLKPKLMFPFLLGAILKMVAFLPMFLATLSIMAFKAVIAGKLALALASFIGFKKLIHHENHQQPDIHHNFDLLKMMVNQHGGGGGGGGGSSYGTTAYGRADFKRP